MIVLSYLCYRHTRENISIVSTCNIKRKREKELVSQSPRAFCFFFFDRSFVISHRMNVYLIYACLLAEHTPGHFKRMRRGLFSAVATAWAKRFCTHELNRKVVAVATSASVTLSLRQRDTRFFSGGDHTNLDSRRGTMSQTTPVTFLPFSLAHHVGFTLLLSWVLMSSDVIGQHRERSLILVCSGVVVLVLISTAQWFTGRADFASSPALIEELSELNPSTRLCFAHPLSPGVPWSLEKPGILSRWPQLPVSA